MSTNSTTELFLMNKKVKISKDTNIKEIVHLLKEDGVHTAYIENKEEVHSLFFTEYDTMFLLPGTKADAEFANSPLEEISEEAFLNLIDYNVPTETIDEYTEYAKLKKPKFFRFIVSDDEEYCFRKKHISLFYYKNNKIHIQLKNKECYAFSCTVENFNKIKIFMEPA